MAIVILILVQVTQIAILTQRINNITEHLRKVKSHSGREGLLIMVQKKKAFKLHKEKEYDRIYGIN